MSGCRGSVAMFTAEQCLAKAEELERRADSGSAPEADLEFAAIALQWRRLAARARVQDSRAEAIARTLPA